MRAAFNLTGFAWGFTLAVVFHVWNFDRAISVLADWRWWTLVVGGWLIWQIASSTGSKPT